MNVARLCHAAQWFAMNRITKNVAQEPTENESAGFLSEEDSTRLSTIQRFFFQKKRGLNSVNHEELSCC